MYDSQLYRDGVGSVLRVHWRLRCETPFVVRNGLKVQYSEASRSKERGLDLAIQWQTPTKSDREVAALYYGYAIVEGVVRAYHMAPASSVRGALRSWMLRNLTLPAHTKALTPPGNATETAMAEYLSGLLAALAQNDSGIPLVASLFGIGTIQDDEKAVLANAGRIVVESQPFSSDNEPIPITAAGIVKDGVAGPGNAARQMTVRNPVDRITHASRDGGLHHFLEFSKGQSFNVDLTIRNPQASDLGLLSVWKREINDGLLRFGALSSIGRGRVRVAEQRYHLWRRTNTPTFAGFERFQPVDGEGDDVLAGLWYCYALDGTSLPQFEQYIFGEDQDGQS